MTVKTGPVHNDKKATVRYAGTSYERTTPAHHTISWTSSHDGTTLMVKIFSASHIEMSFNGTFALSTGELLEINDEIRKYVLGVLKEQP